MSGIDLNLKEVYKLLLPNELVEYFTIIKIETDSEEIHVYLEEKDIAPKGYLKEELLSKGFHKSIIIRDFPIREKASYLHIRRRRWKVKTTAKIISRDWQSVASGTHLTKEFAIFLKGILG